MNMNNHRKKIAKFTVLLLIILQITGCGMVGLPVTGQVMDAETGKPIEGAIVIARWVGVNFISSNVCIHVETAISDEKGKFQIPGWFGGDGFGISRVTVFTNAYKLGYEEAYGLEIYKGDRKHKGDIKMKIFKGNNTHRMEYLRSLTVSCYSGGESEENTLVLRKAIYEEAKDIAITAEDKKNVEWYLRSVEEITYGFEEAEKRYFQRIGVER